MWNHIRTQVERRPALCFWLLAVTVSTVAALFGRHAPDLFGHPRIPTTVAKFGPSIAGLVVVSLLFGVPGVRAVLARLQPTWREVPWYMLAVVGSFVLFYAAAMLATRSFLPIPVLGLEEVARRFGREFAVRTLIGGGLGEEIGWRAFLLPLLAHRMGGVRAGLVVGLAHGAWHLPAIGVTSTLMLTALTTAWGLILALDLPCRRRATASLRADSRCRERMGSHPIRGPRGPVGHLVDVDRRPLVDPGPPVCPCAPERGVHTAVLADPTTPHAPSFRHMSRTLGLSLLMVLLPQSLLAQGAGYVRTEVSGGSSRVPVHGSWSRERRRGPRRG